MRGLAVLFALLCGYWLGIAAAQCIEAIPPMPLFAGLAAVVCGGLCWVVLREDRASPPVE